MTSEHVVLVNELNQVLGVCDKTAVHSDNTPLHRAFSIFLFNEYNQLLLQKRADSKLAWPGYWSNSCCGHPALKESNIAAAKRRCKQELGIQIFDVKEVAPYRYCFEENGIMENEICPILVGRFSENIQMNLEEVSQTKLISWADWLQIAENKPKGYSPWSVEETEKLLASEKFKDWFKR